MKVRWKKIGYYSVIGLVTFLLAVFAILQTPYVQRKIFTKITDELQEISGFKTSYSDFRVWWFDHIVIHDLVIRDPENNKMIEVGELSVNYELWNFIRHKQPGLDGVKLDKAHVFLTNIQESDTSRDLNMNVFIYRLQNTNSSDTTSSPSSAKFRIGEIVLKNSSFQYLDQDHATIDNGFDYYHFKIRIDESDVSQFAVIGDTTMMNVESLIGEELQRKMKIKNLSSHFLVCQKSMQFLNLQANVGKSVLGDSIVFHYNATRDLNDFNNRIRIEAQLKSCYLHPDELKHFTYSPDHLLDPLTISGYLKGKVVHFSITDLEAKVKNSFIQGNVMMEGFPNLRETFVQAKINRGIIQPNIFYAYFPKSFYERMAPFKRVNITGNFTGYFYDFVANATISGEIGKVKSNLNLKLNEQNPEESSFKGALELIDFDLGKYFNDTVLFQKINLSGDIRGKGLTQETTNFFLNSHISSIGVKGYTYHDIKTEAQLASRLFNGSLTVDDPNLKCQLGGYLSFKKGEEMINATATLDTLQLLPLHWSKDKLNVKLKAEMHTTGLTIDDFDGSILIQQGDVRYKEKRLRFPSIKIESSADKTRTLQIKSPYVDVEAEGDYRYTTLFNQLKQAYEETATQVLHPSDKKKKQTDDITPQYVDYTVQLKNVNPLIHLMDFPLTLSMNHVMKGSITMAQSIDWTSSVKIDTVTYQDKVCLENEIEWSVSKLRHEEDMLGELTIFSKNQEWNSRILTKNLFSEITWDGNHVSSSLAVQQDKTKQDNHVRLFSELYFYPDSIWMHFKPSEIKIFDKTWRVPEKNSIVYHNKQWDFHQVKFKHGDEQVLVDGTLAPQSDASLNMSVQKLDLSLLNEWLKTKYGGKANVSVELKNVYESMSIQNKLTIDSLSINNFLIGDVNSSTQWNDARSCFEIAAEITREKQKSLRINGNYFPDESSPFDLHAKFDKTKLKIIEPFLTDIFSQINGDLSGEVSITGSLSNPIIKGELKTTHGELTVDYLKVPYHFTGTVSMDSQAIRFSNFILTDPLNRTADLSGEMTHRNFDDFRLLVEARFTNFQLLNTTAKNNTHFYGQGYGTGTMRLSGSFSNVLLETNITTNRNTRIFIPIKSSASVEKKEFVHFVKLRDTLVKKSNKKQAPKRRDISGFAINMDLHITPDAYGEIIFDIKSGDIIRGYGNGDLKIQMGTAGDFSLFGSFEFDLGHYNFTLYDFINKEFTINKGSRIQWTGDPFLGVLNVTANYRQFASFAPILLNKSEATLNNAAIKRLYPADVILKLNGQMLSPQIDFDITADDLPRSNITIPGENSINLPLEFNAFKAKLDEVELKKQVFSLIVLRRFIALDSYSSSSSAFNSVSELLTNQLSYYLSQVDENLEVDIDVKGMNTEAFNTFQLRMSYSLFNGRLRISRDGMLSSQNTNSQVANIVGEWTVDYLLTPDGKYKVRMYNRTGFNQLNTALGTQAVIIPGVSISQNITFDNWRELFTRTRRRQTKEEKK